MQVASVQKHNLLTRFDAVLTFMLPRRLWQNNTNTYWILYRYFKTTSVYWVCL